MAEKAEKKPATPPTPEEKALRKATKMLAFNSWRQEWRAANPEGTREQRKEAWDKVRKAETKNARRALKALEKGGYKLVPVEA